MVPLQQKNQVVEIMQLLEVKFGSQLLIRAAALSMKLPPGTVVTKYTIIALTNLVDLFINDQPCVL